MNYQMLQNELDKKKPLLIFAHGLQVLIPSLIWSAVFRGFFVCIDPLFFVLLDGRIKTSTLRILKTIWCALFIIALLAYWNIVPLSYFFYLDIVALSSPIAVVLGLSCLLAMLAVFVLRDGGARRGSPTSRRIQLTLGPGLLILKLMLIWCAPMSSPWRQAIITPAQTALKVIHQSVSSEQGFSGPTKGPTFFNFIKQQPVLPPKVVLMIVESWGESPKSLQQIASGLQGNRMTVVRTGFSDYQGATLQGEIRALCSQHIQLRSDFLLSDLKSKCAPAYLGSLGYRVVGMHGYKKEFYSRDLIWKNLGVQERYFYGSLKGLEQCAGPFTGVCDNDLIRYGTRLTSGAEKTFLYLLTLSSHEPLPAPVAAADTRYFGDIETVTSTQVVARNAIASLIAALDSDPKGQCTEAYVVGDHQPPSAVSAGLLEPNKVPFLVMSFHCGSAKPAPG